MYRKGIEVLETHDLPGFKASGMQTELTHGLK
jgi:hypothetical protein